MLPDLPSDQAPAPDPPTDPVGSAPTLPRRLNNWSGTSSDLASVTQTWAARRGRTLHEPRPVTCDRCQDSGLIGYSWEQGDLYCPCPAGQAEYARLKQWYADRYAEEAAWRRQLLEERLTAFSARVLPGGLIPMRSTLPPSAALTKLCAFARDWNGEQGLLLTGDVGTGKTTLLLALVRSLTETLLERKQSVRLVTVPDFLGELRAGFDPMRQAIGESYAQMLENYRTCGVLVFDDLGAEKLTDWAAEQFYLLVDHRYRQRLPIFASSNWSREALVQRLDRRVLDRLRETCTMLEVVGPNWRDQAVQPRRPGPAEQR